MPSSGGSVSDVPTNKTVDGQDHQLAYITPNEAQTLVDQGGKPTMTNEGVMAYPPGMGDPNYDGSGGGTYSGSGGNTGGNDNNNWSGDHDENAANLPGHVEYGPTHHIENIHGEFDDPGSASYDQYYNPKAQATATKESAFGTGKHAGSERWNPTTGKMERFQDYTFKEHWDRAPDAIKMSPTLRFLYATGKNIGEWSKRNSWSWDKNNNIVKDSSGNEVGERALMNAAAPEAPGLLGGTNTQTSQAAKWYSTLGTNTNNQFSFQDEYNKAKTKQASILGQSSPMKYLAVSQSPFFDFLKENKLDRGIL
mgnify:CR=1 FL=1